VLRDRSRHPSPTSVREAGAAYTRKEVCRLLKIDNRQLKAWERQQLAPEREQYSFADLLSLKRIARLRDEKAPPRQIRKAFERVRALVKDSPNLAEDIHVYKDGPSVRVRIGKQKLDPSSGQLLFDFDEEEIKKLLQLPAAHKNGAEIAEKLRDKLEADRWFEHALELEQTGAPAEQIIAAYETAAELDPHSAGALVNLGTVFFNGHAWADAEKYYQRALEVDPEYALAHFNLGNLYDEQGDPPLALHHYNQAIRLQPNYADAHYNLALLHQALRDVMGAVRHWRMYLKLDQTSTWAQIAKRELKKLEAMTVVPGSRPLSSKLHLLKSEKA
jgi:tetratricopeptide (TPR) repeat protein